jgi:hypothetical protein
VKSAFQQLSRDAYHHALKQRSQRFTAVSCCASAAQIDHAARAKQSVLWAGNELETRYAQSSNSQVCQTFMRLLCLSWYWLCSHVVNLDFGHKTAAKRCANVFVKDNKKSIQSDKPMASCQHQVTLACARASGSTAFMGRQDGPD